MAVALMEQAATATNIEALYSARCSTLLFLSVGSCATAHLHERKAQEVESAPLVRVVGPFVVLGEADTPDSVNGACLDENPSACLLEKMSNLGILGKLGRVCAHDDGKPVLEPDSFVETTHLPAKGFGSTRIGSLQNLLSGQSVPEEGGFFRHHEVLCCGIQFSINGERRAIPLAETRSRNAMLAGLVPPEEDVRELLSGVVPESKFFDQSGVVHGYPFRVCVAWRLSPYHAMNRFLSPGAAVTDLSDRMVAIPFPLHSAKLVAIV